MAGIEMVEYSREPNSLPPSLSPEVAKPDISLHQVCRSLYTLYTENTAYYSNITCGCIMCVETAKRDIV